MNKNQKGIIVALVMLILVIAALIVSIGWYIRYTKVGIDESQSSTKTDVLLTDSKTFTKYGYEFRYPSNWKMRDASDNSPGVSSPDYVESGGQNNMKIDRGAQIYLTQTDIAQLNVTADNYLLNTNLYIVGTHKNGRITQINGTKIVQYEQPSTGYDYTNTVFFRKNGTRVTVHNIYPKDSYPYKAEYDALLNTVKIE